MKINFPNPILPQQRAVFSLRSQIAREFPRSVIEIKETSLKSDFIRVSAFIRLEDGYTTSVCEGYSLPSGTQLQQRLNAELVALCGCVQELGITVEFEGEAAIQEVEELTHLSKLSKGDILSCENIAKVEYKLRSHGISLTPLKEYQEELKRNSQRLTVPKAANFLFPNEKVQFVMPKEEISSPIAPESKAKDASEPMQRKAQRSSEEAETLYEKLAEFDIEEINKKLHSGYSNITTFVFYATKEEIDTLFDAV